MQRFFKIAAVVAGSQLTSPAVPVSAQGFNVDCAMLLCLAGGWPKSAECSLAYATFIRRVTPWPIEPPLQIWRCPMGVSYDNPSVEPMQRLYDAAFLSEPLQSHPINPVGETTPQPAVMRYSGGKAKRLPEERLLHLIQDYSDANGVADVDISDPMYNFIRSIQVYDIDWNHVGRDSATQGETCNRHASRVRVGTYGTQGDFQWQDGDLETVQVENPWLNFSTRRHEGCSDHGFFRGVGIEWRDYEGEHGFEVVRY